MRPGSCNSGLRSRPSTGKYGRVRVKGSEVNSTKAVKPTEMSPSTPSTRATASSGRRRLNRATAAVQPPRVSTQSSREPSWAPHTAEMRYCSGSRLLELVATYCTVKSLSTKAQVRQRKESNSSRNWL
ncbi:hypothetical protein D3C80_1163300 [compost metagenome]